MPFAKDWATELIYKPVNAIDAWRGLLHGLESVDFREVPSDVVGRIFQKLISPEERHRFGQHFTADDVVDLINVFCIRKPRGAILDPACGSGSFLVRAYYRKHHLDPSQSHIDMISELFGCDIALYPSHLATLNLAAREIDDEANYPRIARRNFFDFESQKPFCQVPSVLGGQEDVSLPELEAIVGNPPYVRQEDIEKKEKERIGLMTERAWPSLHLSGRSDLHCYFWPIAARLLKSDGYFGFLTSSSWLDVEYGFFLQGWILRNFRIVSIMESAAEPWFEDARVKTCVTILQRCNDESLRMANLVRFVCFKRPLLEIIGVSAGKNEEDRQIALEKLRSHILNAEQDYQDPNLRVVVKKQQDLWNDGVKAGLILRHVEREQPSDDSIDEDVADYDEPISHEKPNKGTSKAANERDWDFAERPGTYWAGKWGRYVRAPDLYFNLMKRFASRFIPLGEIISIRRGITSGCDAFFMPVDITSKVLAKYIDEHDFQRNTNGAARKDVESGELTIIKAGDGSVHPIESAYLKAEVHSLMKVVRPVVREADLDRVVLLISMPLSKIKTDAPWVYRYLRYGKTATFPSRKSRGKPVPERRTCASRIRWYDLTGIAQPGIAFWPMAQQYRHIIAGNPERLICNHNLFDLAQTDLSESESEVLVAVLNSTLVGLFKTFYGRFAGTEGNLKTEVVDVNLIEVPDPRGVSEEVARRLTTAINSMSQREVGRLIEEQLMNCHSSERARRIDRSHSPIQ